MHSGWQQVQLHCGLESQSVASSVSEVCCLAHEQCVMNFYAAHRICSGCASRLYIHDMCHACDVPLPYILITGLLSGAILRA